MNFDPVSFVLGRSSNDDNKGNNPWGEFLGTILGALIVFGLFSFFGCGPPNTGGVYKDSKYVNNTDLWLDNADRYFETNRGWKTNRPAKEFVVLYFYESQADVNALCRSAEDVAGCITSYWLFVVLDHPDKSTRCQAVLHEASNMLIAQNSYKETGVADWQYNHSDPAFKDLVFDERNCK